MSLEGRHRVADGRVADTRAELSDSTGPVLPRVPSGQFTVQLLGGQWFIGLPGAAQRIEDADGLDSWLAANGCRDRSDLDFAGDAEVERQFRIAMGSAGTG